ncbi:MAG: hypothetical protein Q9209_001738 [Squamulea sp. 1 TL-2023]
MSKLLEHESSTTSPAIVYFPSGTYRVSSPIVDYYFTQIIGNPNKLPIIKAAANFSATAVIEGNPYLPGNADHPEGVFIEDGSGGFMSDLTFNGGQNAAFFGNQQFTVRNFTINNANNAINMAWDWGWTFKSMSINNCKVGLNITNINPVSQAVGSATFIDSNINDTPVGVLTNHAPNATYTNSSLVLENVQLNNVRAAVQGPGNATLLFGTSAGGSRKVEGWAQGHSYTPNGPSSISGTIPAFSRSQALLDGDKYYERSKPQYADLPVNMFVSARSAGARGDGVTDDHQVLQDLVTTAASTGRVVFIDAGTYKITRTLYIPKESKIVGEAYPVIMSSGSFFANMDSPQPVVQVGQRGEEGYVEWSDTILSTQGAQPGAVAIQWNLVSPGKPSGMWDVHVRIGGFAGSRLQLADCAATPDVATPPAPIKEACIGAHTSMHVTPGVRGLYMENVWLWTADHDLDDTIFTNITVYAGRGLNMQADSNVWLVGTSVEHHSLYQYQLSNTRAIFMGQIQSETAYYQPNPDASLPFAPVAELYDPQFSSSCNNGSGQCSGWGLRILDSQDIGVYGAGLYSFFNNYNNSCSFPNQLDCQKGILSIEGDSTQNIGIYNLNTVGASSMVDIDGSSVANASENANVFPDTIAVFKV